MALLQGLQNIVGECGGVKELLKYLGDVKKLSGMDVEAMGGMKKEDILGLEGRLGVLEASVKELYNGMEEQQAKGRVEAI